MEHETPAVLHPPPALQALYSLPLLLALWSLVNLVRRPSLPEGLFFAVALWLAWTTVPRGWAEVILAEEELTLRMPLRRPRALRRRQVIGGEMVGRFPWRVVLLRYHPMDSQGRVDIANEEFLPLVPLKDGELVLEWLERKPHGTKTWPPS
ncbi:MAG: hypothetical protein NZ528_03370 [Caldilineales bacterium]|nr:hypothetical protein [Caldilineales bacterium]MDW8317936.1 hypothetical protein [Anaerolineae bacterium]